MQIKKKMIRTTGYYGFDSGVHNKGSNKVLSLNGKKDIPFEDVIILE